MLREFYSQVWILAILSPRRLEIKVERKCVEKRRACQCMGPKKKILRGLRIKKAPMIWKSNMIFVKRWGEILNKCLLDSLLFFIEQVTEAEELISQIEAQQEMNKCI